MGAELETTIHLFVNGTLMRGDILHTNLDGARFVSEARTAPRYRLFSIGDVHPGMTPTDQDGVSVAGEIYEVELGQLERLLADEPAGLGLGVVELESADKMLGIFWVAAELPATAVEISEFGGWREYRRATASPRESTIASER
jgi:AGZA family xanthine/uracil permease-like MFS transporter